MIETKDIYWIAGILEGEGCFDLRTGSNQARVRLCMLDEDVVNKFYKIIKLGSVYQRPALSSGNVPWVWEVGAAKDAKSVMMTVYPLMGQRRQARIKSILMELRRRNK